jgi:SNF2 family DNA or RNA helicase
LAIDMAKKRMWGMGLCDSDANNIALVQTEPRYIWLRLDSYDPDVNDALKSELPGPARFKRNKGVWVFPKHWDTCTGARRVANRFGADLRLTSALSEWGTIEKARQATIPDVNSMEVVDLPRVRAEAPAIWKLMTEGDPAKGYPPRPYQTVGAAFAARNRSCLIADDPGLGKTVQSIAGIIESGVTGPILVVAPKAAATITWPKELKRWLPKDPVHVLSADLSAEDRDKMVKLMFDKSAYGDARTWLITSPNYIRCRADVDEFGHMKKPRVINPVREAVMELFEHEWTSVIVDESHQTLAGGSPGVGKQKWSAQRFGLSALQIHPDGLRIALSGTPFRGKECYLWGQLNWLRPDLFRAYWKWVEKHFDVNKGGFGWSVESMVDEAGMYEEARNVMVRRTKTEVAKDLPPKLYGGWPLDAEDDDSPVAVWLPMHPKQAKAYNAIVKDAAVDLDGGTLLTNGALAELTRLKQFAGSFGRMEGDHFTPTLPSNKFDWLVEFLDERGIAKNLEPTAPKIVVASQFSQLIDVIVNGLNGIGVKAYKFTCDTSNKERAAIEDDWQNNDGSEYRVLCLTTTAGGVSLTLDAADDLVLFDETHSPDDQTQVEDRIHRLSRIHQVTIWKLFSLNTLEEGLMRNNMVTEASIRAIIDGQRGVDFFKHVLLGGKVAA